MGQDWWGTPCSELLPIGQVTGIPAAQLVSTCKTICDGLTDCAWFEMCVWTLLEVPRPH